MILFILEDFYIFGVGWCEELKNVVEKFVFFGYLFNEI